MSTIKARRFHRRLGAAAAALSLFLAAFGPAAARADTPITAFSALPSTTQAGGHPDVEIYFSVANRVVQGSSNPCECEDAKNATVHFPPGFIGNPHATPQCTLADFSSDDCPIDSQVGIVHIISSDPALPFNAAVYNLIPPPQDAGLLGFKVFFYNAPQFTVLSSRTGSDYGLDATVTSIFHYYPLVSFQEDLWGVPANPLHDPLRLNPLFNPNGPGHSSYLNFGICDANGNPSTTDPSTMVEPCGGGIPPEVSNSPETPFLQNPTTCDSPLGSSLDVLSYDGGETQETDTWPQMTGCERLSFNPSLYAQPTTTATDSPSGIDVNLTVPQQLSPSVPSPTELRAATVTLPAGFSINPNAADGKTACTDAEARFGTEEEAQCPEFSKVGSLEIDSSALPGPLPGFVYLGQPLAGKRYRIFLAADGFATHIKLAGTVAADPQTGQLTISFSELPESPLTAFNMHFFGSERGLLATPTRCGTFPVTSTFTPWDSSLAPETSSQFFTLTSGPNGQACPGSTRPFSPSLQVGSLRNTAGAHSPFTLELARADGDQNLSGLTVTTPPGLLATLSGVPYCSDAALAGAASSGYTGLQEEANPSCPVASQIGTATIGAGAGSHPVYVASSVYLAGPYKGAPLSLAVITPVVSGPYDLGNVVVRAALRVNPTTAQITAVSDPLPQILEGIPLRLRSVLLELNRPNFTLNPTSCSPLVVNTEVSGSEGALAKPSQGFQVGDCGSLSFAPKLTTRISGSTNHNGNPGLKTELTFPRGGTNANISRVSVTLPHSEFLDNAHIKSPCTRVQFSAGNCPPGSLLGFAKAETPLLEKPLEGPVYLRANGGERKLPDIVAELKGQIEIDLVGFVESVHGQLRTTFNTIPDAPVSRFSLDLDGGSKGLLVNSVNLCSATENVNVQIEGQNDKTANQSPVLETPCTKKNRRKSGAHHSRRARR